MQNAGVQEVNDQNYHSTSYDFCIFSTVFFSDLFAVLFILFRIFRFLELFYVEHHKFSKICNKTQQTKNYEKQNYKSEQNANNVLVCFLYANYILQFKEII